MPASSAACASASNPPPACYILAVDSDDWLYPDCLQIVTWSIQHHNYAPIFYTDEDKLIGDHAVQPYLKPSFDPVLLLNSAYIAHLGVIDRKLALEHGAYADKQTEGSPDWDLFTRFYVAGISAIHIPEVVYSWRMASRVHRRRRRQQTLYPLLAESRSAALSR